MDNIQLYYIDNEINKIDKMKQGDMIYKNGVELLVVLSYDHNEPCKGCFFYEDKACGSERLIKIANMIVLSNLLAIFFITLYQQLSSPVKVPISVLPRLILIPAS